jgi:hypothetical protein
MPGVPVTAEASLPPDHPGEAIVLAARHNATEQQLALLLDRRGPVNEVRRLVADLDRIAEDLAACLREPPANDDRAPR